jgi:hypothetical protein
MRVAFRFALGYALLSFTYSIYYTVSRPLYGVDVYGRSFVLFIAGAEYIPAVFSFLIGSLSDSIGRRRFMLFSIMGAAPLALIFLQREPLPLLLSISLYSFFNGLASMIGLSSVLESRKDVGRNYSVIGLASSLGWAGGSSIAWLLYKGLGEKLFVALLVLAYLFGLYGLYSGYAGKEREAMGSVLGGLKTVYSSLRWFLPALLLAYVGVALGWNLNAVILDAKLRGFVEWCLKGSVRDSRLLYGLFYGGLTSIVAIPARVIAGRLVDRGRERALFVFSITAYIAIFTLLPFMPPLLFIFTWLVPIYPFYDTSIYALSARSTGSHESTISGYISTVTSIAGLLVIIINTLAYGGGILTYVVLTALFLLASLALFMLGGGGKKTLTSSQL